MKKTWYLIILLLILTFTIGWFLFKQPDAGVSETSKLQVSVSLPLLRNLAEEIGGDQVEVTSIINGPSCNHEYEPASGDLIKVSRAAIFVKAGLGFDLWADKMAASAGKNMAVIDASEGVAVIIDEDHEHGEDAGHEDETGIDEPEGHHHELGNPHYWGNPENVKIMAANILKGLSQASPEKEGYFNRNYQAYLAKLDQTLAELNAELGKVSSKKVISYSAAFPYLYQYFGLDNLATVEITCEQEVSPKRLAEAVTLMRANQIKIIIGEAIYPKLPEKLAQESGAKLALLWPATNESGDYLGTLTENVKKLAAALE